MYTKTIYLQKLNHQKMARPTKRIKRDIVLKFRVDTNFMQALQICRDDSYIRESIKNDLSKLIRYMLAKQMFVSVIQVKSWKEIEKLLADDLD